MTQQSHAADNAVQHATRYILHSIILRISLVNFDALLCRNSIESRRSTIIIVKATEIVERFKRHRTSLHRAVSLR